MKTKIALCVVGGILLAFLLAIVIVCQIDTLHAGAISDGKEHMAVMSDIEGIVEADPRVIDLAMLGAHDASTYDLTKYVGMSGEVGRGAALLEREGDMCYDDSFFYVTDCPYLGKCYGEPLKVDDHAARELTNKWYDRMNTSAMAEAINSQAEIMRADISQYDRGFRVMQMQTAPSAKDIFATVDAWSLIDKAKSYNPKMIADPRFDGRMEVMPVILCDFVTSANGNFNQNINEEIRTYNNKLTADILGR